VEKTSHCLTQLVTLIGLYVTCKVYKCLKGNVGCARVTSDASGSGNVVNIKIHTSNESLSIANEDISTIT
jgi:hypothetical protein